jgi:hypothetical protein
MARKIQIAEDGSTPVMVPHNDKAAHSRIARSPAKAARAPDRYPS